MKLQERISKDFIWDFGEAYRPFGLPRLMGHVVGLLLQEREPVALDDITDRLQVSKGPVSQIMRRLQEHDLVEQVWVPGSRKHYYHIVRDFFGKAFANHRALLERNLLLAQRYAEEAREHREEIPEPFLLRLEEMERFYSMMNRYLLAFLTEWEGESEPEEDSSSATTS